MFVCKHGEVSFHYCPALLTKISVGAPCQLPQPRNAARQMNQRQPGGSSVPRKSPERQRRAGGERGRDSLPGTKEDGGAPLLKASTGHWQPTFKPAGISSCLFLPLTVLGDAVRSAGRGGKCRPPAPWEGGEPVSLCPRTGMRDLFGAGAQPPCFSHVAPVAGNGAVGGWHSPSVVARRGAGSYLQPRQGIFQGADGDPARMGASSAPLWAE